MRVLCRLLCALLFVAWTAELPADAGTHLYCEYWRSPLQALGPLFVSMPGVGLLPWQALLLVATPFCLLWPGAFHKRAWPMDAAIVTSLASVLVSFLWGVLRGGSAYNAYYQLWRFLLALLVGVLLLSTVRSSRDLKALGWTVLAAACLRGSLGIYFYWAHVRGKINPLPPHVTTHDDSLLFVSGLVIVLSWAFARRRWRTWLAASLVSGGLIYAIVLNNRRLAWIELLLALGFAYLLLPPGAGRRRVTLWLLIGAPLVLAYFVVGSQRPEAVFAPARALSTAGSNEDASSLARQEEIRNLIYTLTTAGNPLLGTGWGVPYQKVTSVYANYGQEWWQYVYMPHNSLLGVAVFSGLVGICGIWLVVPVGAFLATRGYRGSTRPVERSAAMTALCVLPAYAAQCYGDIGFQSLTCDLLLGVAIAVAGTVSARGGRAPNRPRGRRAKVSLRDPLRGELQVVASSRG